MSILKDLNFKVSAHEDNWPEVERAVVAFGSRGNAVLLDFTRGGYLERDVEDVSRDPGDFGLTGGDEDPESGIWVWEGKPKAIGSGDELDEVEYDGHGAWRWMNNAEWLAFRESRPIIGAVEPKCRACAFEAEFGSEECPHPVDRRAHSCEAAK